MSVNCKGLLLGKVQPEEIANVVKQKLGCEVTIYKNFHGDKNGIVVYGEGDYTQSTYVEFVYINNIGELEKRSTIY